MREPLERVIEGIFERCQGAYSERTISGYRNDLQQFAAWCADKSLEWLPALPSTLAGFIDDQSGTLAISTIKRRVEAIKFAHRMFDLPSPIEKSEVKLALRRALRKGHSRPQQSQGLTYPMLTTILEACPGTLTGKRDAALLCVGYDSLARSNELTLLEVRHLSPGLERILIPRSKADTSGKGRLAYLSPCTQAKLEDWLDASGLVDGPLFQGLHTGKLSGSALSTSAIRRLVKRCGGRARSQISEAEKISGHSMRVGAAQDMMAAGLDHLAIMQAGGWKTIDVLARYVESAAAQNLHQRRWQNLTG
tara:strand:+ start:2913 stop:3833 length:921 start_codon:yes stop_codon:yes gene_type:complete